MNVAVLRRESSGLIFAFVQHWELLTWTSSPWAIGNFHVVVKAPYFQWSEITKQSNKHVSFRMIELPGLSAASFELEELYPILRLLKRPRHSVM